MCHGQVQRACLVFAFDRGIGDKTLLACLLPGVGVGEGHRVSSLLRMLVVGRSILEITPSLLGKGDTGVGCHLKGRCLELHITPCKCWP